MYNSLPLLNGYQRKQMYSRLPEEYKEALRSIANMEKQSMTWVMEQILVDWIYDKVRIAKPKYRKNANLSLIRNRKAS